jgi:hypothetical protein
VPFSYILEILRGLVLDGFGYIRDCSDLRASGITVMKIKLLKLAMLYVVCPRPSAEGFFLVSRRGFQPPPPKMKIQ